MLESPYKNKTQQMRARLRAGWKNEFNVSYMMTQEGHITLSPDRILSATAGGQVDFYDFIGLHESRGTYVADVKGLEELQPYACPEHIDEWKNSSFIEVWDRDRRDHAEYWNNPDLLKMRVTKDYMLDKVSPDNRHRYRSFLVPPTRYNKPHPLFCIEVPWSIFTEDDKPFSDEDNYHSKYKWYGVDITHEDVVFHDWTADTCFPITDEEVKFRDPKKALKKMLDDLESVEF